MQQSVTARRRLSSSCNPVCGLLHAKVPALGKKRGLPTWKVWKNFWVTAKPCKTGLLLTLSPIKLMYATNTLHADTRTTRIFVPGGSSVRRTGSRTKPYVFALYSSQSSAAFIYLAGRSESESQRWMYDVARFLDPDFIDEPEEGQFDVTVLPGALSAELGLSGVMGRLGVRRPGVALREPSRALDEQGRLLGAWGWKQIDPVRCRLAAAALPEDDGKICVIRTSSLSPGGSGDLTVFCSRGRDLVRCLQTKTASLCSGLSTKTQQRARRMSRSEGDLRFAFAQVAKKCSAERKQSSTLAASLPHYSTSKLATSLVTVGINLAVPVGRTRSYSENTPEEANNNATDNSSSSTPGSTPGESGVEDDHDVDAKENTVYDTEHRRVSNVSVASGVYATIDESDDDVPRLRRKKSCLPPPPLPPRKYKKRTKKNIGGLQAFFRIQKLWRSSSDGHVAKEDDEDVCCETNETIYSEVVEQPELSSCDEKHSSSCTDLNDNRHLFSDLSHLVQVNNKYSSLPPFSDIDKILMIDSDVDSDIISSSWGTQQDEDSIYLPMSPISRNFERHRVSSESGISSVTSSILNRLSDCSTALSDDSIYVTMNNSDRKSSVTSDIYALARGVEPSASDQ